MPDLLEPVPKLNPTPISRWKPEGKHSFLLQRLAGARPEEPFLDVLHKRECRRKFSPASPARFGELLHLAHSAKSSYINDAGFEVEQRNVISSGALHAIHILFNQPSQPNWYWYDPHTHSAIEVALPRSVLADKARDFFNSSTAATVIWYVADLDLISAKYDNPLSLVWRDAGAVQSVHSLISEHIGLAYCPLGISGMAEAALLSDERQLQGMGLALVGDRIV